MRAIFKKWSTETWICSLRGHLPLSSPATSTLLGDVTLSRCLRCDLWVPLAHPPANPEPSAYPKRGRALRDEILLRLIALERVAHVVVYSLLSVGLFLWRAKFSRVHRWTTTLISGLSSSGHTTLSRLVAKLDHMHASTLYGLALLFALYASIAAIEAVGLWRLCRWAEYLTALATSILIPLEIYEITQKITVLRVSAFVVNLAVLVYLLFAKRLFGLRGGPKEEPATDWPAVLRDPLASPQHLEEA